MAGVERLVSALQEPERNPPRRSRPVGATRSAEPGTSRARRVVPRSGRERSVWVAGDLGAAILKKAAIRRTGILDL